jgi:hypothetical protein
VGRHPGKSRGAFCGRGKVSGPLFLSNKNPLLPPARIRKGIEVFCLFLNNLLKIHHLVSTATSTSEIHSFLMQNNCVLFQEVAEL